jgi:diguanylate cyclase (GGDEF)-like protein
LEYLRSILYDQTIHSLEPEALDAPYQKLCQGMRFLQAVVEETLYYSAELSKGNLSVEPPERDNFLCANLKNMHATLNHLTWQAKQVASGDYSQKVSYLGEFSDAFNTMTMQLKEREERLLQEAETAKQRLESIAVYNDLLVKLTARLTEWILVVDAQTRSVVFCNQEVNADLSAPPCASCTHPHPGRKEILAWAGPVHQVWELHPSCDKYFQVNSYPVHWRDRNAYMHIVSDITAQERELDSLSNKAYFDPVTSLHNRLYFEEYLDQSLREKRPLTLAYLDLDGLKYVNDHYGHTEGDHYIMTFAELVKGSFRTSDVFARVGGDEFCLVLEGCMGGTTAKKLEILRAQLTADDSVPYPMSFSYGIYENDGTAATTIDAILELVDKRMYAYKRKNKKERV